MFPFAHLGIGSRIIRPFTKKLSRPIVLLGTILPDVIDKPVYYLKLALVGSESSTLSIISGTRTFAHTALFLFALSFAAILRKSKILAALCLGVGSHFILDSWSDLFLLTPEEAKHPALLWMITESRFPVSHFHNPGQHLALIHEPVLFWGEVIGIAFLIWDRYSLRRRRAQ